MNPKRYALPILAVLFISGALMGSTKPLFNEKANAHHDISLAIANAAKAKKNIVIIFGANW
jgi:hypothetical protein